MHASNNVLAFGPASGVPDSARSAFVRTTLPLYAASINAVCPPFFAISGAPAARSASASLSAPCKIDRCNSAAYAGASDGRRDPTLSGCASTASTTSAELKATLATICRSAPHPTELNWMIVPIFIHFVRSNPSRFFAFARLEAYTLPRCFRAGSFACV